MRTINKTPYKLLLILFGIVFFTACEKPPIEPDAPSYFEKIWEHRFVENGHKLHAAPIIYEDLLIVWPNSFIDLQYDFALVDKITGERTFEFQHPDRISDVIDLHLVGDLLLVKCVESLYCFDLKSESILWDLQFNPEYEHHGFKSTVFNEFLYMPELTSSTLSGSNRDILHLVEVSILSGETEIVFKQSISYKNNWKMSITAPVIHTNNLGETIAYFQISYGSNSESPHVTLPDLVAYNLDQDTTIWRIDDFNEIGIGNLACVIDNNRLLVFGDWSVYCFDMNSGNKLWRTEITTENQLNVFEETNIVIHNQSIFCLSKGGNLYRLNRNSGQLVQAFYDIAPSSSRNPLVNDGKIFYSSFGTQRIHIFDIDKDEFVHHEPYTSFGEDIVYDAEVDLYYTVTDTHLHAFRIND